MHWDYFSTVNACLRNRPCNILNYTIQTSKMSSGIASFFSSFISTTTHADSAEEVPAEPEAAAVEETEEEEPEGMRVDFYLVVFLKFIASIVPTIEVDSTTSF